VHAAVAMMMVAVMMVAVMEMAVVATPVAVVTVVRMTVTVMVRESRTVVATVKRRMIAAMTVSAVVPPAMAGFGFVRDAHAGRGQCSNERDRQQGALQHLRLLGTR
jgi:hypothetical protein